MIYKIINNVLKTHFVMLMNVLIACVLISINFLKLVLITITFVSIGGWVCKVCPVFH